MFDKYIKIVESFKQNQISKIIERSNTKIFEILYSKHVSQRIIPYFHNKSVPFTDYELDPDNISQIKKLINALYYARLTVLDLESVDLRDSSRNFKDLKLLYSRTINYAYEASFLATHLDVDLKDMFHEEFAILLPLLSQIQNFAEQHNSDKTAIVKALEPIPLAYKSGEITGIAIDQVQPMSSNVDYNFLTQFSAVLPSYIEKLTLSIQQYSSQIKENEPKLNKEKLDELQSSALNLLNEIENLKGNSIFVSVKFLNYIHIIGNIITLSSSALEQIGELSESSQDLIRDKLAQLKYTILPTLFGLVDKIEDNAMLKPGTLSVPLMEKVKVLYDALLYLPKKAIDFKIKGEELLDIEDSRFIELRLEMSYKRIDKANKSLYQIQKVQDAFKRFFAILNDPAHKNLCLYQLPTEVKQELIGYYKLLKPYMSKCDLDLDKLIINKLKSTGKEEWSSFLGRPYRWAKNKLPTDHISFVLAKQKTLENLISKDENSQLFHIHLNKDLIDSVLKQANLVLFPYSGQTSVYAIDESLPLQIEPEIEKKLKLTKEEIKRVHGAYSRFALIIKNQLVSKSTPIERNLLINNLSEKNKEECRDLYQIFQPYFISAISSELQNSAKNFKKYLANLFKNDPINNEEAPSTAQFQSLDDNIQSFFTRINFEWADKEEFQEIFDAYSRFSTLLKSQIEKKSELFDNVLVLNHLDSNIKKECRKLYKIFQPYIQFAIPPKQQVITEQVEHYLSDFFSNKTIDILDAPSISSFLKLDKNILQFFSKWIDKSKNYYDMTNHRFLNENETNALRNRRVKEDKLHFKTIENDKILKNVKQLTATQALELGQWYRNKHTKFLVSQVAYGQFIDLINYQIDKNPSIRTNILLLNGLNPVLKEQCRNLYNIFQPYFLDAVPSEKKEEGLKIDKYFVDILSNRAINENEPPSIQQFLVLNEQIQDFLINTASEWDNRSLAYYNLAQEKFILENDKAPLEHNTNTREHYVIQNTNYSKSLHEFRISLFAVTKLFNKAMHAELKPQNSGAPFPEMEDYNQRLSQSRQVCALKDIFNSLYHLEGIILELEKLNNKSSKSMYVINLVQAYGHINEINSLSKRLLSDPHLGFIARELLHKAQTLYASFQEHSNAYQVEPEQVPYGSESVTYNSLWYVLNAFYISPKHIRALKNNSDLSTEELKDLHIHAKKASMFIEKLINNSDSYFKLFLQTPKMIYLYQEMTKKLNEFTSTAHDVVLNNLDQIRTTIFTPMLMEADHWEDKLGLKPGSLSGSLRNITDEFYKGLLHPLDLNSKKHISLVYDKDPLANRTKIVKKQIKHTKKYLKKIDKEYADIENLYRCYIAYQSSDNIWTREEELQKNETKLREAYKKALPKLSKLKLDKKIEIEASQYPEDHVLDDLCNLGLEDYDPHF
ncbi:MAG: SdhA, partial [Legionella longbeachae]|nr:SdhA [Legionella longbeachae]